MASVPQREQLTSTLEPPLPKEEGKKPSVQITTDRKEKKVKVSESRTLTSGRGIRVGAWGGKSKLHSEGRQVAGR